MGAEGEGMRRLTRETCDELVTIPMLGSVESLNVSVASAVCLYEALRQRKRLNLVVATTCRLFARRRDACLLHWSTFSFHFYYRCPNTMAKNGFTTTIVHSDRRSSVEHGAIHKPMHPSSEYAFADSRELAAVFQGKAGLPMHGRVRRPPRRWNPR